VWERGAFPVGVSRQTGKQGIVELCGVSSAETEKSPQNICFVNNCSCNIIDDIRCCDVHVTNQFSSRNDKTKNNLKDFSCNIIDDIRCCDVHVTNQFSSRNDKTENNL